MTRTQGLDSAGRMSYIGYSSGSTMLQSCHMNAPNLRFLSACPEYTQARVMSIRQKLSQLGAKEFFDQIFEDDWKCVNNLPNFPHWFAFCMPKEDIQLKSENGSYLFFAYCLEHFLWMASVALEWAHVFACDIYPVANTSGGTLIAIDGMNPGELIMVSLSMEAQKLFSRKNSARSYAQSEVQLRADARQLFSVGLRISGGMGCPHWRPWHGTEWMVIRPGRSKTQAVIMHNC